MVPIANEINTIGIVCSPPGTPNQSPSEPRINKNPKVAIHGLR
jgi:hypothetical protein